MKIITFLLLIIYSVNGIGQTSYSGYLGGFPITLVTFHYGDDIRAHYVYDKFDTPINNNI